VAIAGAVALALVWPSSDPMSATRTIAPTEVAVDATPSIAVLPFASISADREADYIAEGVTDALTTALDRVQQLRVVSRTSAVAARRSGLATSSIGRMLQTRYLVEGSVRLAGRQVRITARLIDATDGKLLWSDDFVREFEPTAVIDVEESIARSIAGTLKVRLADQPASLLAGWAPANAEAFDAYLWGRHFWATRNPDGFRKSINYFQQAIDKDSSFAPAYSGLADAYAAFAIGNMGDFRADDYFPRARDAARRALLLDSTLAEAHASLGYYELLYNLDWEAASRAISRAIELRPSYSAARLYRAALLEWTGRFADAVVETRTALRLDPLSPAANIEHGRAYFFARRYDEAERQLRLTLDLDSMSFRAHLHLGQVLVRQGRFDEGIRALRRATQMANSSRPLALLANAYATAGDRREATRLLDTLTARSRRGYVPAFDFAIVHAGLRQPGEVASWLERSVADHSIRPYLLDPTFDGVRYDARVRDLLTRLRIPVLTSS
jgi:TolB-like protein/Tfp pilus assembly protein PilF